MQPSGGVRADPCSRGLEGQNLPLPPSTALATPRPLAALGLEALPRSGVLTPLEAPKRDLLSPDGPSRPVAAPLLEPGPSPFLQALGPWARCRNFTWIWGSLGT